MRAIEALLVLVLLTAWVAGLVLVVRNVRRRRPRWRVGVHSRKDGTMLVQLERPGEQAVTARELPPAMDSVDFAASLRVAVEEAEQQAAELNPPLAPRAGPAGAARRPDLLDGHLFPAALAQEGVVVAVAKYEGADVHASLPPAHDRVPHGGRVARSLDPQPRARRRLVAGQHAGPQELALGGDLTRVRVDEEQSHGR
jgi:hypothetical protein